MNHRIPGRNGPDARLISLHDPGRIFSRQEHARQGLVRCWRCGERDELSRDASMFSERGRFLFLRMLEFECLRKRLGKLDRKRAGP